MATHSRVACGGSGVVGCCGGPELGGAAAGFDLGGGRAAGGVQGVQGGVDLAGGLVVAEVLADLAAGQPASMRDEGGVDLFGERLAGRAGQRPGGGSGGVVPERECGVQVLGTDRVGAVGEGVDQREPDRVCFGAGRDLRDDPVVRFGRELSVGVVPELARVGVESDLPGGACLFQGGGEQAVQAGGVERVGVAAFGQQPLPAAADQ